MSPSLGRVALRSRCPVGPKGTVSFTWARCSRCIPCVGYVSPPAIAESWLLLALPWMGSTIRLVRCEDWPQPQCASCCAKADPTKQNSPQQGRKPVRASLWVYCLQFKASHQVCWFLGPHRRDSGTSQCQTLPVTSPGLSVRSHKANYSWHLPVLGLGTHGRGQAVYPDWLPPGLGLGQVSKRLKAPQDLPLPIGCPLVSATEKAPGSTWVVWSTFSGSHQVRVSSSPG